MSKAVKKLRKLKEQLDKLEDTKADLLNDIDIAIDELEFEEENKE
jgi:hypothetical protein